MGKVEKLVDFIAESIEAEAETLAEGIKGMTEKVSS